MSNNCSLSVKKFKDFNYIGSNFSEITSDANNAYNHNNLAPNDILLVGYRYKNATDCPEIKIPLNVITAASNPQAIYFRVDNNNNNELQYTYNDPTFHQNWNSTGVFIPDGCNCDQNETSGLHLHFDENSGNLYYSQNEIDQSNLTNVDFVHINVNSNPDSSTPINDVVINYDAASTDDADGSLNNGVLTLSLYNPSVSGGGDSVVSIVDITSEHESDTHQTAVTVTYTSGSPDTFYIPDGQDGAVPQFRMTSDGMIQYRFNNDDEWVDIGQAQLGGQVNNTTFAFNIRDNAADCTDIGDAYIDWDDTHINTYGHLFYANSISSNNVLHFDDLGRIVGEDGTSPTITVTPNAHGSGYTLNVNNQNYQIVNGVSVSQIVYVSSDNIDPNNNGYNGNISATLDESTAGGDINCYDFQDSGGNSLGYVYIANGADGVSVDHVDCTTPNGGVPNVSYNNFDPNSGAINEFTLYDANNTALGVIHVKNGVNGTNTSGSGQSYTGGSVTIGQSSTGTVDITSNVISVVLPNNLQTPPVLNDVHVTTPPNGTTNGSFDPVAGSPGTYDLSLTIPVHTPTIEIDNTTPGVHQINIDNTSAASIKDGTTMELYRLVASGVSATQVSNENYYRINSSSTIWSKYNPTNGTFEQLIQDPDFTNANFVEVCPADTNISDVINNLTYGTCGMYNNNTLSLYSVKDPTQAGTLCFTIKAYYNIQQ